MTQEQMQQYLADILNSSAENKTLNAIFECFTQIKRLEQDLIVTQNKINEIINFLNGVKPNESAEALNNDIKEDNSQEDPIEEDTGAATLAQEEK